MRRLRILLAGLALAMIGAACSFAYWSWLPDKVRVVLDHERRHQTMTGWEVTARVWEYDKEADRFDGSWIAHRDRLAGILVDDLGIDRIRIEVRSGAENPMDWWSRFESGEIGYEAVKAHFYEKINDNADPELAEPGRFQFSHLDFQVREILLPLRRALEARGGELKVNLCYVDFRWTDLQGPLSHADAPEEYAELMTEAVRHLRTVWDVVPDSVELVLEPDNTVRWRGDNIGRAVIAAQDRFDTIGFAPEFLGPSTAWASRAARYYDALAEVPGAADLMSAFTYHRYDRPELTGALSAIRARADAAGLRTEMLEYTEGEAIDLFHDLTGADASAWQLFMIARPHTAAEPSSSVLIDADLSDPDAPRFVLSDRARRLAPYFRTISRGDVRIGADSDSRGVRPVAFSRPHGGTSVIVQTDRQGEIIVEQLPPGAYIVSRTAREGQTRIEVGAEPLKLEMLAADILTIAPAGQVPTRRSPLRDTAASAMQ